MGSFYFLEGEAGCFLVEDFMYQTINKKKKIILHIQYITIKSSYFYLVHCPYSTAIVLTSTFHIF